MNGIVYRVLGTDGHFFIGSTTQKLGRKLAQLKSRASENALAYFDTVGWVGVKIEAIRNAVPLDHLKTAQAEELGRYQHSPLCLNFKPRPPPPKPRLTPEQRAGKLKTARRAYYLANRATLLEINANYRATNQAKIIEGRLRRKSRA